MENSFSNKFIQSLREGDFEASIQICNKADELGYPSSLVNSWRVLLERSTPSIMHPLIYFPTQKNVFDIQKQCQLGPGIKEAMNSKFGEYFSENKLTYKPINNFIDFIFQNLNLSNGDMLLPDLTSCDPISNLIHYSVGQYLDDCPVILQAVNHKIALSGLDHFLRTGFYEIMTGQRSASINLLHETKRRNGNILYIVEDYSKLHPEDIENLNMPQLDNFYPDILSIADYNVYESNSVVTKLEHYLYENISFTHNICILLSNRFLVYSAQKWLAEIKLKDQEAVFGYSSNRGIFHPTTTFSLVNMLYADITNGCIIANSIDVLNVIGDLYIYQTAYSFYHAMIIKLYRSGVKFSLKNEVLSSISACGRKSVSMEKHVGYWSPFFHRMNNTVQGSRSSLIRKDLLHTWDNYLLTINPPSNPSNSDCCLTVNEKDFIVDFTTNHIAHIAIIIPFKDKIFLLEDCIESLMAVKENVSFTFYAVNNNSVEPDTFERLSTLKREYPDKFFVIDSPGEFNYSKINNNAVKHAKGDYLLFLNNDILFESDYPLSTMLKAHYFHNAIITGTRLHYKSKNIQHNGLAITERKHIAVTSPFCGILSHSNYCETFEDNDLHPWDRTHECSAVTAACMLIEKSDFVSIDGFDEKLKIAYNDVDLCFRAKEKYPSRPIICCTETSIIHLESESRGLDTDKAKSARLDKERYYLINRHHSLFNSPDKFLGFDVTSNDIKRNAKQIIDNRYVNPIVPGTEIRPQKLCYEQIYSGFKNGFAAIFVHYDYNAVISDECKHYIKKLSDYCDIYFVSSSENLSSKHNEHKKITPYCKQLLIRENRGYDFGCWSHVIRDNYEELSNYKGVLLCNDSNYGPMTDFSDTFERIEREFSNADFFGITSSITPSWHLQSFFILYKQNVFQSSYFKQHWFNVREFKSKFEIIINYEVNWSGHLRRCGYEGLSLYGNNLPRANNLTHTHWEDLLKENYPFIKKELLRDNPLQIDLSNLPKILSQYPEKWSSLLDYLKQYDKENPAIFKELSDS